MLAPSIAVVAQQVQMIFAPQKVRIERVREGRSTWVYRAESGGAHFYVRILPEHNASFAPELYIHKLLRSRGVRAPEVIYFEHCNAAIQRSLMITTAIPGQAIGYTTPPPYVQEIMQQAGRELAIMNAIPVQGFGWIRRNDALVKLLQAECGTYDMWFAQDFAALHQCNVASQHDVAAFERLLAEAHQRFSSEPAMLAHGDFDPTHIYDHNGFYSGIIDFGEIRGAQPLYDLGHFAIENAKLLPALLAGYAEITALPNDYRRCIDLAGLLIAARRVGGRILNNSVPHPPDIRYIQRVLNR